MSSIESILAEIDSTVSASPMAKQAAAAPNEVTTLVQKLASAAAAMEKNAQQRSTAPQVPVANAQAQINKLATAAAVMPSMELINAVPAALAFAKTASAQGHSDVEAFRFFLSQKAKELGL
jgi:hypothetical protein